MFWYALYKNKIGKKKYIICAELMKYVPAVLCKECRLANPARLRTISKGSEVDGRPQVLNGLPGRLKSFPTLKDGASHYTVKLNLKLS